MGGFIDMVNPEFKDNWLKILTFNENMELWEKSEQVREKLRIPLTPIEIEGKILYNLFKLLYPKFISDQQHILDVIISSDQKGIDNLYLYETKKAGIHESYRKLSSDLIVFQEKDLDDIEDFYNKLQLNLNEKENLRVGTIRVFKKQAIDLIDQVCEGLDNISLEEYFPKIVSFIQDLFEKELFFIFPEPNSFRMLKNGIKLLNGINLVNFYNILFDCLPSFNVSVVINLDGVLIILKIQKQVNQLGASKIIFKIYSSEDLNLKFDGQNIEDIVAIVRAKLFSDSTYYLHINQIITLLSDLFEIDIPPEKDKVVLFLQKALYGYRSFENHWNMYPRPKVYNNGVRLLLRLLGINLNLRKISHWAIPELISNTFVSYFGLNNKILVILTDINRNLEYNPKKTDYLNFAFSNALLIETENMSVINIKSLDKSEIITEEEYNTLESIRTKLSSEYGYITAVLNIDKSLIKKNVDNFIFKLSKFNPISKLKAFKALKKSYLFNMYPELPPFRLIKDKGMLSLFKTLLPIFIDKHEF